MMDPTRQRALSDDLADRIQTHGSATAALKAARLERGMFPRRSKAKTALWLDDMMSSLERAAYDEQQEVYRRHVLRGRWRERHLKIAARYMAKAVNGTDDLGDDEARQNAALRITLNTLEGGATDFPNLLRQLLNTEDGSMSDLLDYAIQAGDAELGGQADGYTIANRNRLGRQVQALVDFRKHLDNIL